MVVVLFAFRYTTTRPRFQAALRDSKATLPVAKKTHFADFVVFGARDFSPDWKHRYFGTEVPCFDKAPVTLPKKNGVRW